MCGDVSYHLTPPTDFASHCHCDWCRRFSGAAFLSWTSVPENRFEQLSGELREFVSPSGAKWQSCVRCGSALFYRGSGKVYVTLGSLEDELDRKPDAHVSFEEKVHWLDVNDGLPCFKGKTDERLR